MLPLPMRRRTPRLPHCLPQVCQLSRLYESAPAYVTDQPPFLNAAALVVTALPPLELLRRLKGIEVRCRWSYFVAARLDSISSVSRSGRRLADVWVQQQAAGVQLSGQY